MRISVRRAALLLILAAVSFSGFAEIVRLEYYGDIGCAHCDLFRSKYLPEAAGNAGITVEGEYFDVLRESGYQRCEKRLAEMGYSFTRFPVLIIGNNAYQGNSAVEAGLIAELTYFGQYGKYRPRIEQTEEPESGRNITLAVIPVVIAGLVDGVNPCAFATMLFFMSWIALRGGSRKRMLLAGSGFMLGIFSAYLAIGFGFFTIFREAGSMTVLRQVMRYLFTLLSLTFAVLSLRDALIIRKTGKPGESLLQLPTALKKRIHSAIRVSHRSGERFSILLLPGLIITGIVVAFLELACTGQIYFPTITYMVQNQSGYGAVFWLLLYNAAFILPLLILFGLTLAGVSHQRVSDWFKRNIIPGKVAAALLFALLAAVIWISG